MAHLWNSIIRGDSEAPEMWLSYVRDTSCDSGVFINPPQSSTDHFNHSCTDAIAYIGLFYPQPTGSSHI